MSLTAFYTFISPKKLIKHEKFFMGFIGVVGMGMALTTYPIYKKILNTRKKKYAQKIMELSEKLLQK